MIQTAQQQRGRASRGGTGDAISGRVLVIDDDPGLRDILAELLDLADYAVQSAADGPSGLALLDAEPFDLLLTDLVLPGMDGMEIVRRVRRSHPDLAVVIVTGQGSLDSAVQAIQQGAYDYICKPFHSEELLERVKKAIERRRLEIQNRQLLADLKRERELLQVRVDEATASLRKHLEELEQLNREQMMLFRLVTAARGKTVIDEVVETMVAHLRDVMPVGATAFAVFDAAGNQVAEGLPEGDGPCRQVGEVLVRSGERVRTVLRGEDGQDRRQCAVRDLLIHGGVAVECLDRLLLETFSVGQSLYGVIAFAPADDSEGFADRHGQLLSLAMAQMMNVCEENLLLERGTQLVTMGELISEIVHDLRSPLTSLRNNARYLAERLDGDSDAARSTRDMLDSASQMEGMIGELLSFSRPEEMHLGHLNVCEVIDTVLRMTRDYLQRKEIRVVAPSAADRVMATGNAHHLVEAFVNLVVNATQAMGRQGTLCIEVEPGTALEHPVESAQPAPNQRFVRVTVADTGCGIAAKNLPKVFHRFYTTKSEGTGLGLSSVQRIVRQNLGHVAVESEVGVGTRVFVYLLQ